MVTRKRKHPNPLNRDLYNFLWDAFNGDVRVSKPGQPFRYTTSLERGITMIDPVPGGGGEEYQVNCPLCGDKRKRLYINHRYGTDILGAKVKYLAYCHNEKCRVNTWLHERMEGFRYGGDMPAGTAVQVDYWDPDAIAADAAARCDKLIGLTPVDSLPAEHPAARYLDDRGFNRAYLYDRFRVGFYEGGGRQLKNRRIAAPVYHNGLMVGWNARAVPGYTRLTPGDPAKPWPYREGKYVNSLGFPKAEFLYNLDLARQYRVIVVMEGVTDVWRAGEWGVALMGKTMSESQRRLLCQVAEPSGAWIVLLGDASTERDDAASSWRANQAKLLDGYVHKERVRLHLFDSGDPASRTTQELHSLIMGIVDG